MCDLVCFGGPLRKPLNLDLQQPQVFTSGNIPLLQNIYIMDIQCAFWIYCIFKIKLACFYLSVLMLPAGGFVVAADSPDSCSDVAK